MITWIQTRFQTGYKILFFFILIIVIVAFVFTVGDAPGMGRAGERAEPIEYFGYNLRSQADQQEIIRLASISYYLNRGRDPGEDLTRYAYERLAYLGTGRDLGLPSPDATELQAFISALPAFRGPDGQFDRQRYQQYLDQIEAHPRMSTADLIRVMDEDYVVRQTRNLIEGPGYAIPYEVKRDVARQQTEWTLELASLPVADLDVEVEADEDVLTAFYQENDFRYEVPVHKAISYVIFDPGNYLDQVDAPSEEDMRDYFEANRGDFLPEEPETNGDEEEPEEPEVRFEDVADEIETLLRREQAPRLAREAASDFTFYLFENQIAKSSDELAQRIAELDLERRELEPFAEGDRPAEVNFSEDLIRDIRRLDEDRYFTDPRRFGDDIVVALLEETIPAYVPPFEEVRQQVESDYREEERRRLRTERASEIHESLRDRIADGANFAEAAEAAGLEVSSIDPFIQQQAPDGVPPAVLQRLRELRRGDVSRMIQANDLAYFVYVADRQVPEIDETQEEFLTNLQQTRNFSANIAGQFAIQEIQQRAMPRTTEPAR